MMDMQGAPAQTVTVQKTPLTLETMALARADAHDVLAHVQSRLTDREFLKRLNDEREYLALPPENLQLFFILQTLAENPAPPAREVVGNLARSPIYRVPGPYLAVLLETSVYVIQPPAGLIELWQEQLAADASELGRTVAVVVANGSPEAVALFENALLENRYREDYVFAWLRNAVLRHRQDADLLRAAQRLLQAPTWPSRLKEALVEVLFDYKPDSWYHMETPRPKPPPRDALSEESRRLLFDIADLARREKLVSRRRHRTIRKQLAQNPGENQ